MTNGSLTSLATRTAPQAFEMSYRTAADELRVLQERVLILGDRVRAGWVERLVEQFADTLVEWLLRGASKARPRGGNPTYTTPSSPFNDPGIEPLRTDG